MLLKGRRLKRLAWSIELGPGKYEMIAALRKLPDDAVLISLGEDLNTGTGFLMLHSEEWPEVQPGSYVPVLDMWVERKDVTNAQDYATGAEIDPPAPRRNPAPCRPKPLLDEDGATAFDEQVQRLVEDMYGSVGVSPPQLGCQCDLAYTGEKQHKVGCPVRKR